MRLALFISSLSSGGAERVMSLLASLWAARGDDVFLFTYSEETESFYGLHDSVHLESLGLESESEGFFDAVKSNVGRIQAVRKVVKRVCPDVVVSFMDTTNIVSIVATRGLGVPVVVAEHIHPPMYPLGRLWESLRSVTYPFADRVLVLTRQSLMSFGPLVRRKGRVMPNPVVVSSRQDGAADIDKPFALAVGRLNHQKGFDRLLWAFSKLATRYPRWDLVVLGEGPLRKELELLRNELGLQDRVFFPGTTRKIQTYYAAAEMFVLSSRFEGFPMALCEAMEAGLPPVSFSCPTGPDEIVRHEIDGILVPNGDIDALADGIARLIEDESLRRKLAARGPEILDRFGMPRILKLWDDVFRSVGVEGL